MTQTQKKVEIKYFSGYIRNYRSLCAELGVSDDLSRKARENEILVKSYEKWGTELAKRIYGAFVIAIWDSEIQKLFLIRDQVGQKHMYYAPIDGELLYSGDINEIANDPKLQKRLNKSMLRQYLFYGFPIGSETFYEGVYKLMPGHIAQWDGKTVTLSRYFKPEFEPDESKTIEQWAEELRTVIDEITNEERADDKFPYKESFLSGGVDSSYLLAASDAVCANTVGYAEAGFDESELAKKTAGVLGKGFRVKNISPEEFFERIPETIDKLGQPLGDASAVAFSLGCAAVKEHADVVYSGEGIDEFFGGYNAHKREIPSSWVYLTCSHIMNTEFVRLLMNDDDPSFSPENPVREIWKETAGQDPLARKLTVDISLWLEGDIYFNTDRTSTACEVELHTPFSDLRLFNTARKIPSQYLFMNDQNKYAFRLAAASKLPEEVAFRKKVGFPVPVRDWMADPRFAAQIEEKLFGKASQLLFNQDAVQHLWNDYKNGEKTLWNRVYALYVFLIWYDLKFGE